MAPWALAVCLTLDARADQGEWPKYITEGLAAEEAGDYGMAIINYQAAIRDLEGLGITDARLLRAVNLLGGATQLAGRYMDAEQLYRRALKLCEKESGVQSTDYAVVLSNLGTLLVDEGQTVKGLEMLSQSLAINRRLLSPGDVRVAVMENALARGLLSVRKHREAESLLEDALSIWKKNRGASGEAFETITNNLASVRLYQGRWDEARELIEDTIASAEKRTGPSHPGLIRPLNNLAYAYAKLGKNPETEITFRRALDLCEKFLSPGDPVYTTVMSSYSGFLKRAGRKSEARSLSARAKEAMHDAARRNGVGMTVDASTLRGR
jgi:tetratricopeptide (TPR) repeat protein